MGEEKNMAKINCVKFSKNKALFFQKDYRPKFHKKFQKIILSNFNIT